ncbi:MAG TPA: peptidoglycan-binding protein, partial [Bryobacterales bacterium]|nr:peptidoglycan-binding protein [Bryobacterales bacterium]
DANEDQRRAAQRALESKGYYRGAIDGIVGPRTKSGLREYQGDNGLEVTGKLDAKTAQSLGVN